MDHTVTAIRAFNDNYIWAISALNSNHVVLVDPGCADACIKFIEQNKLTLVAILITHHHYDHVDGIKPLINYYNQQDIRVYTPAKENIPCTTTKVHSGDNININELSLDLTVLEVPGHTLGHVAYYNKQILFCGDTLFSGGCGRLFEGSAAQMYHSLQKLTLLNDNTQVYCAHEYTLANLAFALTLEPDNPKLVSYHEKVKQLRANKKASIPTTIAQEKAINPFLRCEQNTIHQQAEAYSQKSLTTPIEVFSTIREWKNNF